MTQDPSPSDVVSSGDSVTAIVTKVDAVDQKISLSIRAVSDRAQRDELKRFAEQQSRTQTTTFGDLLKEKLGPGEAETETEDEE